MASEMENGKLKEEGKDQGSDIRDRESGKREEELRVQDNSTEPAEEVLPIEAKLGRMEPDEQELVNDLEALKREERKSYMSVFPSKVSFETQETDEQVVLVLRRHPVTNWKWIFFAVMLGMIPFVVLAIGILPAWLDFRYQIVMVIAWELLVTGYVFEEYLRWYFNIYVVTDRRVVDIDFVHLLHREINDADLLKIEDVTVRSQGMLAAIFNYGGIYVQTAAQKAVFEFTAVKEADKVASVIRLLALHREKVSNRQALIKET